MSSDGRPSAGRHFRRRAPHVGWRAAAGLLRLDWLDQRGEVPGALEGPARVVPILEEIGGGTGRVEDIPAAAVLARDHELRRITGPLQEVPSLPVRDQLDRRLA